MPKTCFVTGSHSGIVNNVSHSKRRTKRRVKVNLTTRTLTNPKTGAPVRVPISARGWKTLKRNPAKLAELF